MQVYILESEDGRVVYIGQTTIGWGRIRKSIYATKRKLLGATVRLKETIEVSTKEEALDLEEKLIAEHKATCVNIAYRDHARKGAAHPLFGVGHSLESRQKMSLSHTGVPLSAATRKKMSEMRQGEKHPFFGKHHKESTIQKLREAGTGRVASDETKKKMSETHKARWAARKLK